MPINYPRSDREGWRRFLPSWKLVLGVLATLFGVGVAAGVLAFIIGWLTIEIPEENEVATAQTSIVYWSNGKTEMARLGDTNRISVPLSEVPEHARYAVLAAEDRNFYEHWGFDVAGFVRALVTNLRTGSTQGGSTITQQYAKNAFLSSEQTYVRKFKELVLSLKLELRLSKDEILERYLNTIYYGRGAYGIETAAEAYFRGDSADLTLEQSAALAALINAPGALDPDKNLPGLKARYSYVLDGMVQEGWLDPEDGQRAQKAFPEIAKRRTNEKFAGPTGHLIRAVTDELAARGYDQAQIESGGLRVISTFNRRIQRAAVTAVNEQGPQTNNKGVRIGLAAVEPITGEVVAMYGGANYLENSLNNATQGIQQAGSTFKPFGLAAAVEDGIGLDSLWPGNSPTTVAGYEVVNYADNSYGDQITLLRGTEESVNTVYVSVSDRTGVAAARDAAKRAGIPEDTTGWAESDNLTFVLGTASPHTIDVANAYATFAARGQQTPHTVIRRIGTSEGGVLYERRNDTESAFDQDTADVVNYALQSVVQNGTGGPARALGRPVAAKTGSTDEYMSAWFAGYVPQLATAVSFSKDGPDGNPVSLAGTGGMPAFYGSGYPARVWTAFMLAALEGKEVKPFVTPANQPTGGGMTPTTAPQAPAPGSPQPSVGQPTAPSSAAPSQPATSPPAGGQASPTAPQQPAPAQPTVTQQPAPAQPDQPTPAQGSPAPAPAGSPSTTSP